MKSRRSKGERTLRGAGARGEAQTRYHETVCTNVTRHCKTAQVRPIASPIARRKSRLTVVLSTWEGQGPWDPGGKPPREQNFTSKRLVEAVDLQRASCLQQNNCVPSHVVPITSNQTRTWHPSTAVSSHHREAIQFFGFKAHREGTASSGEVQRHCAQ
jgi:hypothetical protein